MLPSERYSFSEPALCHYDYDMAKGWFVHFNFTDNLTGDIIRKQYRGGINYSKTKEERLLEGNALKTFWKKKLYDGWNAFTGNVNTREERLITTDAIDRILLLKQASTRKRTGEAYRYITKLFSTWLKESRHSYLPAENFDPLMAIEYMDHLKLTKKYSNRTYNDHLIILKTFFNEMIKRDWITRNPFRSIQKEEVEVGRNIAFTEKEKEDLKRLLYNDDRQLYYFTQFIYFCYIRRSELTLINPSHFDWRNKNIIIPSNVSKNKKQESVVIPDAFLPVLEEMRIRDLPADHFIFGRQLVPSADQYINPNHISSRHTNITRELITDTNKGLYSWKHTGVCTAYNEMNGDIYSIMRQLRHSELTTTQIYLKSLGLMDNSNFRKSMQ